MIGSGKNNKRPIVIVRPRQVNTIIEEEQEFIDQELTKIDEKTVETAKSVLNKQKSSQNFSNKVINLRSSTLKPTLSTENLSNKTDTQSKQLSEQLTQNLENAEKLRFEKPHLFTKYDPSVGSPQIPFWNSFLTYFGVLIVLQIYGGIQDILRTRFGQKREGEHQQQPDTKSFTPLYTSYEGFVIRNIYSRVKACFDKPICSVPGARLDLVTRKSKNDTYQIKYEYPGTIDKGKFNLGSYNYLGFANNTGSCADKAVAAIVNSAPVVCSTEQELGRNKCHNDLEKLTAEFLNVDEAMIFGMGFATNSMNIPALVNHKSLIISDQRNHASIVTGCRLSGATIQTFRHNDMDHLEEVIRKAVLRGNPKRYNRPWDKILIIVEGVYSMEGTICDLRRCVEIKKKYKAFLFLDEAHSIGALGETGRGCCEYWNVDHSEVDILMGTFTKSFGAAGGYIAGSHAIIQYLRNFNHGSVYAASMSPPVAAQAMQALKVIGWTEEGRRKIKQLAENSKFFRRKLTESGFVVYGDTCSPVVPVLTCEIGKLRRFQTQLVESGLAAVVVGFPATHMCENRARFCLTSAHSIEDLEKAVKIIRLVGDEVGVTYLAGKVSKV